MHSYPWRADNINNTELLTSTSTGEDNSAARELKASEIRGLLRSDFRTVLINLKN